MFQSLHECYTFNSAFCIHRCLYVHMQSTALIHSMAAGVLKLVLRPILAVTSECNTGEIYDTAAGVLEKPLQRVLDWDPVSSPQRRAPFKNLRKLRLTLNPL